jgi:hypothetical protein
MGKETRIPRIFANFRWWQGREFNIWFGMVLECHPPKTKKENMPLFIPFPFRLNTELSGWFLLEFSIGRHHSLDPR